MNIKIETKDIKLRKAIQWLNSFGWGKIELNIHAIEANETKLNELEVNSIFIEYVSINDFFLCLGSYIAGKKEIPTHSYFKDRGIMLDCARNAVPNIQGLKHFIVRMAFCGYTYLGLYLEDCLEVEDEPLFGYMRGRYKIREIQELVEFASYFGIEIVPYIQTLAHLSHIFNHWDPYYANVRDINDILLMGEPRTYILIENIIKSTKKAFGEGKIHIGMDEAFLMTCGKYKMIHGDSDVCEVFQKHVQTVCEICDKYNMQPEAWADMFLKYTDKIKIPKNLKLTCWSYTGENYREYGDMVEQCKTISKNVTFCGGIHKWYGFTPLNEYSCYQFRASIKGVKGKTDTYCLALWGDDGAECSYNAVWYSIIYASNLLLGNFYTKKEMNYLSTFLTGYKMKNLLEMDLPNRVFEVEMKKPINVSKYLFYSNLFMGIADRANNLDYTYYFKKNARRLKILSKVESPFSYLFKLYASLCEVLSIKNQLLTQIRDSYEKNEKSQIKKYIDEDIPLLLRKLELFHNLYREQFLRENKAFGVEILEIRINGEIACVNYVLNTLKDYERGKIEKIEQLEEKNMSPSAIKDEYNGAMCFNSYEQNITYGSLVYRLFN